MDTNKVIFILKGIYSKSYEKQIFLDLVNFSTFNFEGYTEMFLGQTADSYEVTIYTDHEIYIRDYRLLQSFKKVLYVDLKALLPLPIEKIEILPDYDKLEIVNSEIRPVYTEWEEINRAQAELIKQLNNTSNSFDIKNIGNTARNILKNLAKLVFKNEKHTPQDQLVDVSNDKYKNQLHSYIDLELAGKSNAELRGFADAAISLVEKAIVLANAVTHRKESERQVAEVCVTGIITVISIITYIEKK